MRGLIIGSPWVEAIAAGRKTWELRGGTVRFRERIALIRAGEDCVVGTAVVSDCLGPMTARQLARARDRHGVEPRLLSAFARAYHDQVYAWVLTDARELRQPVEFHFPRGAVIWVKKIPPRVERAIEAQMRLAA